jgi:hypothetical protein|tara:strand:- start:307 stop:450 length:144 start_codon:yes stop_codon:yes gene_type:complete
MDYIYPYSVAKFKPLRGYCMDTGGVKRQHSDFTLKNLPVTKKEREGA